MNTSFENLTIEQCKAKVCKREGDWKLHLLSFSLRHDVVEYYDQNGYHYHLTMFGKSFILLAWQDNKFVFFFLSGFKPQTLNILLPTELSSRAQQICLCLSVFLFLSN